MKMYFVFKDYTIFKFEDGIVNKDDGLLINSDDIIIDKNRIIELIISFNDMNVFYKDIKQVLWGLKEDELYICFTTIHYNTLMDMYEYDCCYEPLRLKGVVIR